MMLHSFIFHTLFFFNCVWTIHTWQLPLPGGRRMVLEDGGILRIQLQAPPTDLPTFPKNSDATTAPEILQCLEVRDTGTVKGYGAFCVQRGIPKHSFLGFYEGTVYHSRDALEKAVTTMDYVMSLDGGATFCDGFTRAQDRTTFSPVHLNHADKETDSYDSSSSSLCNCLRLLSNRQVAFFTAREIQVGEELCFDYGDNFWKGRETEKV